MFSAIASAATLISLNFVGKESANGNTLEVQGENPLSTVSKNAFVEGLPSSTSAGTNASTQNAYKETATVSNSSNLTRNLAGIFAKQMIEKNSSGPQPDESGNLTKLNLPSEKTAEQMIKDAISKTAFTFDDKISVASNKILSSSDSNDATEYFQKTNEVLNQISAVMSSGDTSAEQASNQLALPGLAIESALLKLSSLSVPKPLTEFHTAILRLIANQKNIFSAIAGYQSDPLKAVIAIENENEIVSRDIARVQKAASKIDKNIFSLDNSNGWREFYSELFGMKKVYAQGLPVFDAQVFLAITAQTTAQAAAAAKKTVEDWGQWLYETALRIAVNVLINEFQNEVVNWIAGNGDPKFITDWSGFFRNVLDKAIGETIYNIIPQACTGLGPLLRVNLLPVPNAYTGVRCTLTQVVNNVNAFFDRFSTGGWYAYSYAMQPNNNYFGELIIANDILAEETARRIEVSRTQAQVNKGFLSVTKCTKYVTDEAGNETTTCEPGYEVATTPGNIVGESLTQSLNWKPNQIVSARRFEDLVAAIVNASINRVVKEGLSALTEATNPPPPSFTNATPANVFNPGSTQNLQSTMSTLITSLDNAGFFQKNQAVIDADAQFLALATSSPSATSSAIFVLNQLANSCGTMDGQIQTALNSVNSLASTTQAELTKAINIKNARNTALTSNSANDAQNAVNILRGTTYDQMTNLATTAQTRLESMQSFISASQNILLDGNCGAVLPTIP